jgi:hypothetical protein
VLDNTTRSDIWHQDHVQDFSSDSDDFESESESDKPVGSKPKAIHPPTDRKGKSPKKPEDDETDASSTHQSRDDADTTSLRPSDISEYSTDEND